MVSKIRDEETLKVPVIAACTFLMPTTGASIDYSRIIRHGHALQNSLTWHVISDCVPKIETCLKVTYLDSDA